MFKISAPARQISLQRTGMPAELGGVIGLIVIALSSTFIVGAIIILFDIKTTEPSFYFLYSIGLLSPTIGAIYYSWKTFRSVKPLVSLFSSLRFGPGAWMILALPCSIASGYMVASTFGLPFYFANLPTMNSLILAAVGWSSIMWAEEIGWRGVLLPVLQKYISAMQATLVIVVIWVLWHLPLLYILDYTLIQYALFSLQILGISAILTWAYNQSGTILVPILIHGCGNAMGGWLISAVPEVAANDLIGIQAAGPVFLGILIVMLTKGRLGMEKRSNAGSAK
ncbi:CPBP family intramembrane glutamic endopeptidase [Rheinheimera fenheensis]|uniref:CPBP family intramembrane glutamic endopeptidase n=1 Tax=Rheinheimera fenheensis TaxID=3152295 RepID=UPI003261A67D